MEIVKKKIILNKPHAGQIKVLNEAQRFNVLCCGRRWGKTKLAVNLLIEPALKGLPTAYFTPTYKLLEETFNECANICADIIIKKHDQQFIHLETGGKIEFWSLDNPLAGRSRKYARDIIDEASFTKDLFKSWNEAIRPTLTDLKGDAYFLSTPRGKNDFFKLFMKGQQGDNNWKSWQMSTYTNPFIDPEEIDDARKDLPELAFSQEYLAEFNDNAANPFGIAYINQCVYPLSTFPAVCYAVDLAKSYDYTVIIGLDKLGGVCHFQRFQMDWASTTREILNLPKGVPIIIDSTGVGDPIGEDIARHRNNVELFKFTANTKQQIMEGLAAAIQQRRITFPEGIIVQELSNFEYQYTNRGVKYSAPSGLHDDAVCALAMAVNKFGNYKSMGAYSMGFA
jgi:hypothetical protein